MGDRDGALANAKVPKPLNAWDNQKESGVDMDIIDPKALGAKQMESGRLKQISFFNWRQYRDISGWLIFIIFLIFASVSIDFAVNEEKPPKLICAKEPCLHVNASLNYVALRSEIYKVDDKALIIVEDNHGEHLEDTRCHSCLSKCRHEGTCISTCTNATLECHDTNTACLASTTSSNACPANSGNCIATAELATCVGRCQKLMQFWGTDCREDVFRTTKEKGCYYLNSQRCKDDKITNCSKTVYCHYDIKDDDACIPAKYSLQDRRCLNYMDLEDCMYWGAVDRQWVDTECTRFRETAYHQIIRNNVFRSI